MGRDSKVRVITTEHSLTCFTQRKQQLMIIPIFIIAYLYIRWYMESELEGFGLSKESLLFAYYIAAASIFEPERSLERLAWAKTTSLLQILESNFEDEETRSAFVDQFNKCNNEGDNSNK